MLTPRQFREMKEISGQSFTQLAKITGISRSQLCEFGCAIGKLRPDQLEKCEAVLGQAMREHSARIARLVRGERVA